MRRIFLWNASGLSFLMLRSLCSLSANAPFSRISFSYLSRKFIHCNPILSLTETPDKDVQDLKSLHALSITTGLIKDTFSASRLVEYCLQLDPIYAHNFFNTIHLPDVYTWNAMIKGLAERVSPTSSVSYFFRMLLMRVPPTDYTFALIVKSCIIGKEEPWLGKKVHGQILKHGMEDLLVVRNSLLKMYCNTGSLDDAKILFNNSLNLDMISWNSMISGYGKHGDAKSARRLFDHMPNKNLVSWSALIDGYVRVGDFAGVLHLFYKMLRSGVEPDVVTLVSVLKACANMGAFDLGRWVHMYIEQNKLMCTSVILGTALIDMYGKCGCIDVALKMFHEMREKDVILWNSIIGGLAMHGHGKKALELFWQMRQLSIVPNESTFVGVLCACAHAGLVREGCEIFKSIQEDYGIEPQIEHYGCLADLLGRAGLVGEAEEVLTTMPMEPKAKHWGALLAACRTHNNVEVGERIGRRLIALEPHDGGRYVLLSNVYAGASRWNDALDMRRSMEEQGIKKDRGCSSIE